MRRILVVLAILGTAITAITGCSRDGREHYDVNAVFDTAKGMVAGQQVKIAGVVAGKVARVELAPGPRARMRLRIDPDFEPFRADANCRIVPEGLISENFVECDPGSSPLELPRAAGGTPTITVDHTTAPVSLQDVMNIFALPTSHRLRVVLDELGLATAGRGRQLNAVLRRANPALGQARRVLATLDGQRRELSRAVAQTDAIIAELAHDDRDVRKFISHTAIVTRTTATRRAELGESVRRLPAMLDAARPGLRVIDEATRRTTPILREIRAAAPGLRSLTTTIPAFARVGEPALRELATAAVTGRSAVRAARPVVAGLRRATGPLAGLVGNLDRLLVSTRDTGGVEGLSRLTYAMAILSSMYDDVSHIISAFITVPPRCIAANAAHSESKGCDHSYDGPGQGTIPINQPDCGPQTEFWFNARCKPAVTSPVMPTTKTVRSRRGARSPRPGKRTEPSHAAPRPAPTPAPSGASAPPLVPDGLDSSTITDLLDYLLG